MKVWSKQIWTEKSTSILGSSALSSTIQVSFFPNLGLGTFNLNFRKLTILALDLLAKMLEIDPKDRPYASELLKHPVFKLNITGINEHNDTETEGGADLQNFHEK